jgi:hypothetical protein
MVDIRPIPSPIAEAIDAGIPAAKAFRIYADTSIPELAAVTQLAAGRICLIEAGMEPTDAEVSAISRALRIPAALMAPER